MFTLLFKFTASICMLLLLLFIGLVLWFGAGDLSRNLAAYRAYNALTCGQFINDLQGADTAAATRALDLFTAPAGNIFLRRQFAAAGVEGLPSFRAVVETCHRQRAYTLVQAVQVARQTDVAQRAREVMSVIAAPHYDTPNPVAAPTSPSATLPQPPATLSPTAQPVSATSH